MYIGIDVGGTNLKAGLVDENGRLLSVCRMPVNTQEDDFCAYLGKALAELVEKLLAKNHLTEADIPYVGAGLPGTVDAEKGIFLFAPNLPICNAPLREAFQKHCSLPLYLANDANCAALGEAVAGSGKEFSGVVLVTLGTGIGTGIVFNGEIWTGCNGGGGEGGHMVIYKNGRPCGCGRRGCFETYASETGLVVTAIEKLSEYPDSILRLLLEKTQQAGAELIAPEEKLSGLSIFGAAEKKDAAALDIVDAYLDDLSEGLLDIINLLQPEVILIGGGISHAEDELFLQPLCEKVSGRDVAKFSFPKTKILKASLGNDAGMIGAAMLGKSTTCQNPAKS